MTPPDVGTCDWLTAEIAQVSLLDPAVLEPVVAEFVRDNPYADATALAEYLVRLGLLSRFQANRLLDSEGRGLVLGPYVLADTIGTGSLGTVYLAWGRADRQAYAVKVLPQRSPWNARLARRKLQALPTEPHPGIVPFVDVGTSASRHYLVWPFVEGDTLETVVRRDGLLSSARAARIGMQTAQALQYCEHHRVYHGLIKPSNIMIGHDGQARLLDFGLGTMLADDEDESMVDTLAESNAACNMFDCASPESIIDPAKRTVRGDQYSLGCTLYYGLTGRFPFPEGTIFDKMLAHQSQQPLPVNELNPTVPPGLALVIERLMQKAPEARYNNIADLVTALLPMARQSAIYAPPAAPTPPPFLNPAPAAADSWARPNASLLSAMTPMPPLGGTGTPRPVASMTPTPGQMRAPSTAEILKVAPPAPPPAARLASRPESNFGSIPGFPYPPSAPQSPLAPPAIPLWQRLLRRVAFWRPRADPTACTLLTAPNVLPGETASLQLVVHHANRSMQARALDDWRGTAPLPGLVERGATIGLHLAMQGLALNEPLTYVQWHGLSAAALLKVPVPTNWPPGRTIQGTLTIGLRQHPVATIEFCLPIAGALVHGRG